MPEYKRVNLQHNIPQRLTLAFDTPREVQRKDGKGSFYSWGVDIGNNETAYWALSEDEVKAITATGAGKGSTIVVVKEQVQGQSYNLLAWIDKQPHNPKEETYQKQIDGITPAQSDINLQEQAAPPPDPNQMYSDVQDVFGSPTEAGDSTTQTERRPSPEQDKDDRIRWLNAKNNACLLVSQMLTAKTGKSEQVKTQVADLANWLYNLKPQ